MVGNGPMGDDYFSQHQCTLMVFKDTKKLRYVSDHLGFRIRDVLRLLVLDFQYRVAKESKHVGHDLARLKT